jgi:hypothetical protein
MTNRFGFDLYPKEVRWAAAERVSEDVIAAVLLLHERSVDEIVPRLRTTELEKVIELVGRSPHLYPRGILEALEQRRSLTASAVTRQSVPPNAAAKEEAKPSAGAYHPRCSDAQLSSRTGADAQQAQPSARNASSHLGRLLFALFFLFLAFLAKLLDIRLALSQEMRDHLLSLFGRA